VRVWPLTLSESGQTMSVFPNTCWSRPGGNCCVQSTTAGLKRPQQRRWKKDARFLTTPKLPRRETRGAVSTEGLPVPEMADHLLDVFMSGNLLCACFLPQTKISLPVDAQLNFFLYFETWALKCGFQLILARGHMWENISLYSYRNKGNGSGASVQGHTIHW